MILSSASYFLLLVEPHQGADGTADPGLYGLDDFMGGLELLPRMALMDP
jgi:hypothetical protein